MSGFWDGVKGIVATVAPTVATALGGPLAGVAVRQLGAVLLGDEGASPEAVRDALAGINGEQLVQLKTVELEFKARMKEAGIELERVAAQDRDSARRRQVEMRDWTPTLMGVLIVCGFFGALAAVVIEPIPPDVMPVFTILLGALGAMTNQVGNYFFGSSVGSKNKDATLAQITAQPKAG